MKKVIAICLLLIIILIQNGCSKCSHKWQPATCSLPMICELCGHTNGNPNESAHKWLDSNCCKKAICEHCFTQGDYGDHQWVNATYEKAKYCNICKAEEGLPLLDSTDKRYVIASSAYYHVIENVFIPSSVKIERAKYTNVSSDITYPTVILECSVTEVENGVRIPLRCYAYLIPSSIPQDKVIGTIPGGSYTTYVWEYGNATVWCRLEDALTDEIPDYLKWENLNADLIIERYNRAFK